MPGKEMKDGRSKEEHIIQLMGTKWIAKFKKPQGHNNRIKTRIARFNKFLINP